MKIIHVNRTDEEGGAAKAALRLHKSLLAAGNDSRILVDYKTSDLTSVATLFDRKCTWRSLLLVGINGLEDRSSFQYLLPRPRSLICHPWLQTADLVHLHNIHGGYLSLNVLPKLSKRFRVVWTLHDMWPLTGHCGYSYDCERWKEGCGSCPYLKAYPPMRRDRTYLLWKIKKRLYAESRLVVVSPSQWLCKKIRESPLMGQFPVHHIPYGLDLNLFRPLDQAAARRSLNLPLDLPLILFGAAYATEERKGYAFLYEALQLLLRKGHYQAGLITFGSRSGEVQFSPEIRRFDFGPVADETIMMQLYSASDLTVCPSLADNLPLAVLESMACGTPVVAFDVGGISEAIEHLKTGFLSRLGDASDLARGIVTILENKNLRFDMGVRSREVAEKEYALDLQLKRHWSLYESVLKISCNFSDPSV